MDSAVKEMNYRIKGTEMFWNNSTVHSAQRRKQSGRSDQGLPQQLTLVGDAR